MRFKIKSRRSYDIDQEFIAAKLKGWREEGERSFRIFTVCLVAMIGFAVLEVIALSKHDNVFWLVFSIGFWASFIGSEHYIFKAKTARAKARGYAEFYTDIPSFPEVTKNKRMTEEKILQNAHIPTAQIEQDIADTAKEVQDMEDEKEVLMRNPQANKVRIYFIEGGIPNRLDFIKDLNDILEYRKKNNL